MEEPSGASGLDADGACSPPSQLPPGPLLASRPRLHRSRRIALGLVLPGLAWILAVPDPAGAEDTLSKIRREGRLLYGSDMEGGGPFAYPDPSNPRRVIGFEVEMMAHLGRLLGEGTASTIEPVFAQGQWDRLLSLLNTGRVDMVVNGYEWTPQRARDFLATRPYYVYQLQVMAPRGGPIRSWSDLQRPKPGGGRWRVGVLVGSAAETFAREQSQGHVEVVSFDGSTDAMLAVRNRQIDATLQDWPAAKFYENRFPELELAGPREGRGYYVIYVRQGDEALRDALDQAIDRLIASGELRAIFERFGIWNDAQEELADWSPERLAHRPSQETLRGWRLIVHYAPLLGAAALMTVVLSVVSMPIAMAIGLLVALGRLYGPFPLRVVLGVYVEVLRGTPLMLQLFVLFFLLPEIGIALHPLVAGIAGLAINYSAYEAEIYRAGLQAIPAGQMEAALALGMSRPMALRRVVVPQAVRIVIPPVTNDFIALFKDTSVCSVITLRELTKEYSLLAQSTGGVVEFAVATAILYLAMSLPLAWFSRWYERRLDAVKRRGGALP